MALLSIQICEFPQIYGTTGQSIEKHKCAQPLGIYTQENSCS